MDCALCRAFTEQTDRIVYRNEHAFVLINHEPLKYGHVLILPIRHVEDLGDLTPEESQAFLKTIDQCMRVLHATQADSPTCFVNGWKHRTQSHLHAHVIPSKNPLRTLFVISEGVAERQRADAATLKLMAEEIRKYFRV